MDLVTSDRTGPRTAETGDLIAASDSLIEVTEGGELERPGAAGSVDLLIESRSIKTAIFIES